MKPGARKVALVTGASAGIGKAIVRRLLRDGWIVYGAARRLDQMEDIKSAGARVVALDVTDDASMIAAVRAVVDGEGRLDALVNNAGYGSYGAIEDVPLAEARRQFEVNVFGLARLCQLVLPTMRAARSGLIVNISSMGGRIWMPIGGWYHATKHALEVLSDTLRVEVRPFGVRVVVIQPGAIESEWSGIAARTLRASSENSVYGALIAPMARILEGYKSAASPEVVADAVSLAVNSTNPRRRYAVPFQSKLYIFARFLLPDWAWERVVAASVK
jgi:NAD(P)-dependent dehydrogenase (short-subunit alcohol dehydrogenase family)